MTKKRALICGALLFSVIAGAAFTFIPRQTITSATAPLPTPQQRIEPGERLASDAFSAMSKPISLIIPALAIHAPVHPVGLTREGAMDVPNNLTDVGWYENGVTPGTPGKAVLAAHTGYPMHPTKYRSLEKLMPGAEIQIVDDAHNKAVFEVIKLGRYTPLEAPRDMIFGDSPTARLAIITCIGAWNAAANTYDERLVVYAARVR